MTRIATILLLSIFICSGASAAATKSKLPVEVTADSLEVIQDRQQAIFSGKVAAKQGDLHIRADKMLVYYTKKGERKANANSISKIEASGNVFLSTPQETAQSHFGLFEVDKDIITLTNNVIVTSGKNVVKGEKLVYNLATGQSRLVSKESQPGTKQERVRGIFIPSN
ncbi:MAG: hypothetical protein K0R98_1279 [Rickettsiaceae bacterium]|jgi:lipopolysaccharide export system protein LptA|nr:hypothetical protein [Rickettsiaceae bacterium]